MVGGYAGGLIEVNLTSEKIRIEKLDEQILRKFIGGGGLAAKILWDQTKADTEAFSEENLLIFMTGPMTGTIVPSSNRYVVACISPLTGIYGEAHAGGYWPHQLKHSGFDGIIFRGRANSPKYLWVHDGEVELRNSDHLWGKDTYETDAMVKKETSQKAAVACIGLAGENLVRFAIILNDGKRARALARCGVGAVMGYKNLKAVAVHGTMELKVSDRRKLSESVKNYWSEYGKYDHVLKSHEELVKHFRHMADEIFRDEGNESSMNWRKGQFKGFTDKIFNSKRYSRLYSKPFNCYGCPSPMCTVSRTNDGETRTMHGENYGPLGKRCLIDDVEAIGQAYDLCERLGMDTISTGAVIAFAMECYEKGLINKEDTGGVDMIWGNANAMLEMVKQIGQNRGFGRLLGQGVKRAADKIGGLAHEYAIHVKGLEIPIHEPRAYTHLAIAYATGSIGAAHEEAAWFMDAFPEVRLPKYLRCSEPIDADFRHKVEGKAIMAAKTQDYQGLLNSLVICVFLLDGNVRKKYPEPSLPAEWLSLVTGWDVNEEEFLTMGERCFNMNRIFNVRRGISRKDDILPNRFLTHKRGPDDYLIPLGKLLNQYYSYRGWSEEGIPRASKLAKLGLLEMAKGQIYIPD